MWSQHVPVRRDRRRPTRRSDGAPTAAPSYTWAQVLAVNFLPGVVVLATVVALRPLVAGWGWPDAAAYTLSMVVVTPLELALLVVVGVRSRGGRGLRSAITLPLTRPRRSDLALVAGFVAGTAALSAALAPVNEAVTGLAARVFPHAPGFDLDQGDVARYGITAVTTVLAFNLVVDAVVNPFVEELYWKGHLLPRLPVAGLARPLVAGSLFALQHFWEPGDVVLVAVVQSALCWLTLRRRSLTVPLFVHWVVNVTVNVVVFVTLVG